MDDTRRRVQERFGGTAQNYVTSQVHGTGYTLDKLIELVKPAPGKRALDIATGGGHVALALARHGAEVIASDLTLPMLRAARQFISEKGMTARYANADAQRLPFANGTFDMVTTRLAPHHFPDVAQYVAECARVVRPGGVFGLVDHAGATDPSVARYVNTFERLRDPSHVWEYSQGEWEALFVTAGFRTQYSEVVRTRLNFNWWTQMQNVDEDTSLRLRVMLKQAPQPVAEWLEPEKVDGDQAAFTRWQLILIGIKEQ
jgi:ubiquinone/menaquinone biosynthesis C-methylase UbiE